MTPPIFALLTDFGLEDEYVGVVKAVLLSHLPRAQIFDLCHAVPPQDIATGALILARGLPYLPPACFVIAVIDPGVGGKRRLLATRLDGRWYLAPDNGLLTPVLRQNPEQVMVLHPPDELLSKASATFHGRDILAPMAVNLATRLALGGTPADLGETIATGECCFLPEPLLRKDDGCIQGKIIHIDHFGNLISNICRDDLSKTLVAAACMVTVGGAEIRGISEAYHEKTSGEMLALWDSQNHLEIAVSGGSAAKVLGVGKKMTVEIRWLAAGEAFSIDGSGGNL